MDWTVVAAVGAIIVGLVSLVTSWRLADMAKTHSQALQAISRDSMHQDQFVVGIGRIAASSTRIRKEAGRFAYDAPDEGALLMLSAQPLDTLFATAREVAGACAPLAGELANEYRNLKFLVGATQEGFGPTAVFTSPQDADRRMDSSEYLGHLLGRAYDWVRGIETIQIDLPVSIESHKRNQIGNLLFLLRGMGDIKQVDNLWAVVQSWERPSPDELASSLDWGRRP